MLPSSDSSSPRGYFEEFPPEILVLTLNIPRGGGPLRTPEGVFCDPAVTISTNLLLIFVCVPHQLKINIM